MAGACAMRRRHSFTAARSLQRWWNKPCEPGRRGVGAPGCARPRPIQAGQTYLVEQAAQERGWCAWTGLFFTIQAGQTYLIEHIVFLLLQRLGGRGGWRGGGRGRAGRGGAGRGGAGAAGAGGKG